MSFVLVSLYNMGDCPNPLVGYILGPLTDLPLAILHIQDLISAPIPLIHINADSNLLAAGEEIDIPIEVSLYSVIRDTCLAMTSCDCTLVANVVYEALGATAETWQQVIRTSRVFALQPKKTELVIALLEDGCCRAGWGLLWFKAVRLSPRQLQNFAYHNRMMIEVRKGTR
jgi:hypothetical protein